LSNKAAKADCAALALTSEALVRLAMFIVAPASLRSTPVRLNRIVPWTVALPAFSSTAPSPTTYPGTELEPVSPTVSLPWLRSQRHGTGGGERASCLLEAADGTPGTERERASSQSELIGHGEVAGNAERSARDREGTTAQSPARRANDPLHCGQ